MRRSWAPRKRALNAHSRRGGSACADGGSRWLTVKVWYERCMLPSCSEYLLALFQISQPHSVLNSTGVCGHYQTNPAMMTKMSAQAPRKKATGNTHLEHGLRKAHLTISHATADPTNTAGSRMYGVGRVGRRSSKRPPRRRNDPINAKNPHATANWNRLSPFVDRFSLPEEGSGDW